MTKKEFLALKDHARIKYIGKRPLSEVFETTHRTSNSGWGSSPKIEKCVVKGGKIPCSDICETHYIPKTFAAKGAIVYSVYEDTYGRSKGDLSLTTYSFTLEGIIPAEWELVDARNWVEGETEFKYARAYIPQVAKRFKDEVRNFLERYKSNIDYKLESLPLDKKLKLIMELSPEDKKWFGIMNTEPDAVISLIEKAFQEGDI